MSDVTIDTAGKVGRITLNRPKALNALTHAMSLKIEAAIDAWALDDSVAMVVIDASGERAFCSGGDIAAMYHLGKAGNFATATNFWRDEYRLNAKLANYGKPIAAFMQGFVMGGGVGLGCHASHRIVGETTHVAMPECGIGLVPDVGGSLLLARAPGRLGEYLGLTGKRMRAADAIHTGFADTLVPEDRWPDLIARLEETGDPDGIDSVAERPVAPPLARHRDWIDRIFATDSLTDLLAALAADRTDLARETARVIAAASPISTATTLALVRRSRARDTIEGALELEFRATTRALEQGDFVEGVRALVIDKDKAPRWQWAEVGDLPEDVVETMLAPLGDRELNLEEQK